MKTKNFNTRKTPIFLNEVIIQEFDCPMEANLEIDRLAKKMGFLGVQSEYTYYYVNGINKLCIPEEDDWTMEEYVDLGIRSVSQMLKCRGFNEKN